jgi:hypothetical protein
MSGDHNGYSDGHAKKLEQIGEDVHFVKESVIPISVAIKDLNHTIQELSGSLDSLGGQIRQFMEFQERLFDQHAKAIPLKLVVLMFLLVFALIFGEEVLRHYLGFFGGVA